MKSLRTNLTLSILTVNILVISLLSLSIIFGFFKLTTEWNAGITTDIGAFLNNTISKQYPDIKNLEELDSEDFTNLINIVLDEYKGKLRSIRFFSLNEDTLFKYNITDLYDRPSKALSRFELIRMVSIIRSEIFQYKPESSGTLMGINDIIIGKFEILSSPLMGYKYTGLFDRIITSSFLTGIILTLIVSFGISYYISRKLSRQSETFATQLSELADGKRNITFTDGLTSEINSAVNAAECLQKELGLNEKIQQQRLEDILHDLKTPVSALGIQFEAVRDNVLQLDSNRIELLSTEFKKIEEMIIELTNFIKLTSTEYIPQQEPIIINQMIDELKERFLAQAARKKQSLKIEQPKTNYSINSDRIGLQRILNNITINALNNAPEDSTINIHLYLKRRMSEEVNQLFIEIENEGRLDEKDLPFIFDRLYRSKMSGYRGNGLGLAISKTIVEKNGGKITAMNTEFNTVIFRIVLPMTKGQATPKS